MDSGSVRLLLAKVTIDTVIGKRWLLLIHMNVKKQPNMLMPWVENSAPILLVPLDCQFWILRTLQDLGWLDRRKQHSWQQSLSFASTRPLASLNPQYQQCFLNQHQLLTKQRFSKTHCHSSISGSMSPKAVVTKGGSTWRWGRKHWDWWRRFLRFWTLWKLRIITFWFQQTIWNITSGKKTEYLHEAPWTFIKIKYIWRLPVASQSVRQLRLSCSGGEHLEDDNVLASTEEAQVQTSEHKGEGQHSSVRPEWEAIGSLVNSSQLLL